jgi:hypothetical protein
MSDESIRPDLWWPRGGIVSDKKSSKLLERLRAQEAKAWMSLQ